MKEKIFQGVTFEFDWCSYKIHLPNKKVLSFEAYAGNKVFDVSEEEAKKIMQRKAKYEIKKLMKEQEELY